MRYQNRFTPRRPCSNWSAVNIKRVEELTRLGLMRPSGLQAFASRTENRSGIYSYEQRPAELPPPLCRTSPGEQQRLGVLPDPTSVLPENKDVMDRQRQD